MKVEPAKSPLAAASGMADCARMGVFLSYSKRDRDLAERVVDGLQRAGLPVWWDKELTPRESWDRTIEREIAAADHVLALWTANSVESDWVRIEANYASNCKPSKLVQARFDDAPVPIAFSLIQFVDLDRERPAGDTEWDRLLVWLRAAPASPAPAPPRRAATARTGKASRWPLPFAPRGLALLLGPVLYLFGLIIMGLLAQRGEGDDFYLFGFAPAIYLTYLFGLPYVFARAMPLFGILYFLSGLPAVHFIAHNVAALAGEWAPDEGQTFEMTFVGGAIGGLVGSALAMALLLVPAAALRTPDALRQAMIAVLALPLIGGLGLYAAIARSESEPWNWAFLYLPWQLVFAFYLAKILEPAGGTASRERMNRRSIDGSSTPTHI